LWPVDSGGTAGPVQRVEHVPGDHELDAGQIPSAGYRGDGAERTTAQRELGAVRGVEPVAEGGEQTEARVG
jgi:hypothetical protein